MMKTAVLASLVASAAAFAPASVTKTSTATQFAASFDDDIGVTGTPGMWDPLNLVDGDQAKFDKLRFSELKNGRVAMMAWLGYATTWGTNFRFPGCENFPGGHKAVLEIPPLDLLLPIFAICGFLEVVVFKQKEGSFPGDMGGGAFPVGFGPYAKTAEQETELRTSELLNGRAAMMGWLTLLVHEQLDGKPFIFFDSIEPYTPFGSLI